MKLLLDMGLAPRTADYLQALGHEVDHLGKRGLATLADLEVMRIATDEARVLVTFDLDFSRIIALQRAAQPSVILFRLENFTTDEVNQLLADLLSRYRGELEAGAIVVVDPARIRVRSFRFGERLLPILLLKLCHDLCYQSLWPPLPSRCSWPL